MFADESKVASGERNRIAEALEAVHDDEADMYV